MPKPGIAIAGALGLLLASCDSREPPAAENAVGAAEGNSVEVPSPVDPAETGEPANSAVAPVPPPAAVSHPDGYLPPAPSEPEPQSDNSSGAGPAQPATEDEYIRNRQ